MSASSHIHKWSPARPSSLRKALSTADFLDIETAYQDFQQGWKKCYDALELIPGHSMDSSECLLDRLHEVREKTAILEKCTASLFDAVTCQKQEAKLTHLGSSLEELEGVHSMAAGLNRLAGSSSSVLSVRRTSADLNSLKALTHQYTLLQTKKESFHSTPDYKRLLEGYNTFLDRQKLQKSVALVGSSGCDSIKEH